MVVNSTVLSWANELFIEASNIATNNNGLMCLSLSERIGTPKVHVDRG